MPMKDGFKVVLSFKLINPSDMSSIGNIFLSLESEAIGDYLNGKTASIVPMEYL